MNPQQKPATDSRTFVYQVNGNDRITDLNEPWLDFARENRAEELTRRFVLNRMLWDFITGAEAKGFYQSILDRVRTAGKRISLPYRCDSPRERRFMEMEIIPVEQNGVRFESTIVRIERRNPTHVLDSTVERRTSLIKMCSWCKKVFIPDEDGWFEIEEAITMMPLITRPPYPDITHGICNACYESIGQNLPSPNE